MKIFITGGTSGIGLELAKKYLSQGHQVAVCGRHIEQVNIQHLLLQVYAVDVCDQKSLEETVLSFAKNKLDMMILCAGDYIDMHSKKISNCQKIEVLKVHLIGVVNSMEIARKIMQIQGYGNIVVMSSVAGLLDYPQSTLYAKCKRTIIQIAGTYRNALADCGIHITTIIHGYIDTPKMRTLYGSDINKLHFCIPMNEAIKQITNAIVQKKSVFIFPKKMKWIMYFLSLLPSFLLNFIMQNNNK